MDLEALSSKILNSSGTVHPNDSNLSPVYTTLNFWYGTDKIGTRTTFLVLGLPKCGTVPKIERSVIKLQL
jgi:hypothetical protein